jgi:ribosomal protein S18 acetylase RimI-like enzyme
MKPLVRGTGQTKPETQVTARKRAWAYERGRFWVLELSGEGTPPPTPSDLPVVLGEVPLAAVGELAYAMDLPNPEIALQRFAGSRRCFAAWAEDRVAAYCWVSQTPDFIGELEHEIRLPPGEAYIWDCATLPAFRRKHLYTALLNHLTNELRAEGLQRVWIGSSLDNRPSMRAFSRSGFQPVVTVLYVRLFRLSCMLLVRVPGGAEGYLLDIRRMLAAREERAFGPFLLGLI